MRAYRPIALPVRGAGTDAAAVAIMTPTTSARCAPAYAREGPVGPPRQPLDSDVPLPRFSRFSSFQLSGFDIRHEMCAGGSAGLLEAGRGQRRQDHLFESGERDGYGGVDILDLLDGPDCLGGPVVGAVRRPGPEDVDLVDVVEGVVGECDLVVGHRLISIFGPHSQAKSVRS